MSTFFVHAIHKYFSGFITKISDPEKKICKVLGSWTSHIEFNGVRYWELDKIEPAKIYVPDDKDVLLSDCRYREDSIWLARRDLAKSQEYYFVKCRYIFYRHKIRLEVI